MSSPFTSPPRKIEKPKEVVVTSFYDIQKLLLEMERVKPPQDVSATITSTDENGKRIVQEVHAKNESDHKSLLIEGFQALQKRQEVLNKHGDKAKILVSIDRRGWIDELVEKRFGAVRDGLRMKWDVADGIYFYDPLTKKLTKQQ